MKKTTFNRNLFGFLKNSPTPYHAAHRMADMLHKKGYTQLREEEKWQLSPGSGYYIIREDGALVAFHLSSTQSPEDGFRILGAHTDSPCLQIKPQADITKHTYHQLGVEVYGGALLHPWFDRDLSLAGRLCCRLPENQLESFLIDFNRPLLTIPSVAIHLNREANSKGAINSQKHLPPIIGLQSQDTEVSLHDLLITQLNKEYPEQNFQDILGYDLFCYDLQEPSQLGSNDEIISSGRLDNLLSCFVGVTAMLSLPLKNNSILICNNHEEIGSTTTSGALGTLLSSVLKRLIPDHELRTIAKSNSFLISMDNAHATHPNYWDKSDPKHTVHLNRGPVIKINASQRYATSSYTKAIFEMMAGEVGVTTQDFVMRSDMPCGSTIGPLTAAKLGIRTVDIGAPTLGMHSIREITGDEDPLLLYKTISHFLARPGLPG